MPFTKEQREKVTVLYEDYLLTVRPMIAMIEAKRQKFPIEILNEIRAFHDHVARCYHEDHDDEKRDKEINKAKGHVKRMSLDCFKILCMISDDEILEFEHRYRKVDLTIIDNGDFTRNFSVLHSKAKTLVKEAKDAETLAKHDLAFDKYQEAFNTYEEAILLKDSREEKLTWARHRMIAKKALGVLGWLLSIIISSIVGGIMAIKLWVPIFNKVLEKIIKMLG